MHVAIRFYERGDADAMLAAAHESTAEVYPWLGWCHPGYSIEEARSWIDAQIEARLQGSAFEFAITSADGAFLGGCGINHLNMQDRCANLGYWVRTSATGRGVAPAAVRALSEWAFTNTDLERLELVISTKNGRSRRVAEKVGAVVEGVARSRLLLGDTFHDAFVYSLVRNRDAVA